jgi:cytochrome c oxidase assembly protein subunit 15
LAGAIVVNAALVISLGTVVTGSGPHSGDAGAQTRNGFDPRSVAWLHADLVLLFLGLTLGILVALIAISAPRDIRNAALWVIGISIAQGTLGYVQYFSGVPWGEVLVHQLGACLTWITVIWLWLTTRSRGQSAT